MIIKIGDKEFNFDGYANINEIAKAFDEAQNKAYQQGRADAKKEINEIMDMDVPISNILYEIDKWLKEQKNGRD